MDKNWFKLYQTSNPSIRETVPIIALTLPEILQDSAEKFPKRPALNFFGKRINYQKLNQLVDDFAVSLFYDLGIRKGDRVAIMLPNCPQSVIAYYAILKLGAVVVQNNPLYTEREVSHQIKNSGAETIITLDILYFKVKNLGMKNIVLTGLGDYAPFPINKLLMVKMMSDAKKSDPKKYGELKSSVADAKKALKEKQKNICLFKDFLKIRRTCLPEIMPTMEDLAMLQYTGGTTGVSKGAMLTHRNLVANISQVAEWFKMLELGQERFITVLPLFHIFAITACQNFPFYLGAESILLPKPDKKMMVKSISKYKATIFAGSPTMYLDIVNFMEMGKNRKKHSLKSIKFSISGAAPLYKEIIDKFEAMTGCTIIEGFGLTEASPITHCGLPDKEKRIIGSIGIPLPNTDVKIVNENGEEVSVGEEGEMVIKGPQVMKGYWQMPEETENALKGGWLHTGDIAKVDESGCFYIIERKKNMIDRGGLKIFPREVEEIILNHPSVKEAALVGQNDKRLGEVPVAVIVLIEGMSANEQEIIAFCKEHLAPYKIPVKVIFKNELPKTSVGKTLHRVLKEEVNREIDNQ